MEPGMSENIISCSKMIVNVLNNNSFGMANNMGSVWKKVVSKIRSYEDNEDNERHIPLGERLAGNTRVVDLKKGILLVETDHSGWIQYLRMYQKFIITGLKREFPNLQINTMAFRLAGSTVGINDNYEENLTEARKNFSSKLDEQEKELENIMKKDENSKNSSPSSNLPPEILAKFESIKQSMLTNSEK